MEAGLDSGGKIGEFTVWVNGRRVEEKGRFSFPDKHKILKAVKEAPESPQPPG